jgi:hyaluronoglucosaminidase
MTLKISGISIMTKIGVVEGFFGPAWPIEDRESYASFLATVGAHFYIYAPKQDQHLRKGWRLLWDENFLSFLQKLKQEFHRNKIEFGVALSPFGLGETLTTEDSELLEIKVIQLKDLGIDILGIFYDDMHGNEHLAQVQLDSMKVIEKNFDKKIIFCPTYYCFDPILEKVFGKKPDGYLEKIAAGIKTDVALAWTGPKVISPEIPLGHIQEVKKLLKRKPYIWENLFANDGPRNCKFLKVKAFTGRDGSLSGVTEAWAFNMMNQPQLSKIVFLASKLVLDGSHTPDEGLDEAIKLLCSPKFAASLKFHRLTFLEKGLDQMSEFEKKTWRDEFSPYMDASAQEIVDWLDGKYLVGSECLTD